MPVSFRKVLLGTLAASLLAVPAMAEVKIGVIDLLQIQFAVIVFVID